MATLSHTQTSKEGTILIIETEIRSSYGTDHEYIVRPVRLAKIWTEVTGRKTVNDADLDRIDSLARLFFLFDETKDGVQAHDPEVCQIIRG
jgi:hypothetical protein